MTPQGDQVADPVRLGPRPQTRSRRSDSLAHAPLAARCSGPDSWPVRRMAPARQLRSLVDDTSRILCAPCASASRSFRRCLCPSAADDFGGNSTHDLTDNHPGACASCAAYSTPADGSGLDAELPCTTAATAVSPVSAALPAAPAVASDAACAPAPLTTLKGLSMDVLPHLSTSSN